MGNSLMAETPLWNKQRSPYPQWRRGMWYASAYKAEKKDGPFLRS